MVCNLEKHKKGMMSSMGKENPSVQISAIGLMRQGSGILFLMTLFLSVTSVERERFAPKKCINTITSFRRWWSINHFVLRHPSIHEQCVCAENIVMIQARCARHLFFFFCSIPQATLSLTVDTLPPAGAVLLQKEAVSRYNLTVWQRVAWIRPSPSVVSSVCSSLRFSMTITCEKLWSWMKQTKGQHVEEVGRAFHFDNWVHSEKVSELCLKISSCTHFHCTIWVFAFGCKLRNYGNRTRGPPSCIIGANECSYQNYQVCLHLFWHLNPLPWK